MGLGLLTRYTIPMSIKSVAHVAVESRILLG